MAIADDSCQLAFQIRLFRLDIYCSNQLECSTQTASTGIDNMNDFANNGILTNTITMHQPVRLHRRRALTREILDDLEVHSTREGWQSVTSSDDAQIGKSFDNLKVKNYFTLLEDSMGG